MQGVGDEFADGAGGVVLAQADLPGDLGGGDDVVAAHVFAEDGEHAGAEAVDVAGSAHATARSPLPVARRRASISRRVLRACFCWALVMASIVTPP